VGLPGKKRKATVSQPGFPPREGVVVLGKHISTFKRGLWQFSLGRWGNPRGRQQKNPRLGGGAGAVFFSRGGQGAILYPPCVFAGEGAFATSPILGKFSPAPRGARVFRESVKKACRKDNSFLTIRGPRGEKPPKKVTGGWGAVGNQMDWCLPVFAGKKGVWGGDPEGGGSGAKFCALFRRENIEKFVSALLRVGF